MDDEIREKGKEILSNYVSLPKNITILEKNIYRLVENSQEIGEKYLNLIYEVCFLLSKSPLKTVNEIVKAGKIDWENDAFHCEKQKQKEKDEFITNPFEAHESIEKCPKCYSNKTYSYQRQVRSADEGFSTFSTCFQCGNKWRIN